MAILVVQPCLRLVEALQRVLVVARRIDRGKELEGRGGGGGGGKGRGGEARGGEVSRKLSRAPLPCELSRTTLQRLCVGIGLGPT